MHYAKKLNREIIKQETIVRAATLGLNELESHLSLPKFREDTTVQVQDVFNWIMKIKQDMNDAEFNHSNHLRLQMIDEVKQEKEKLQNVKTKLEADPLRGQTMLNDVAEKIASSNREIERLINLPVE